MSTPSPIIITTTSSFPSIPAIQTIEQNLTISDSPLRQEQVGMTGSVSSPKIINHVTDATSVEPVDLSTIPIGSSTPSSAVGIEMDILTLKKKVSELTAMTRMQGIIISAIEKKLSDSYNDATVLRSDISLLKKEYSSIITSHQEFVSSIDSLKRNIEKISDSEVKEQVKKLRVDAIVPKRANPDDACKDLYALYTVKKVVDENGITHEIESEEMIVPARGKLLIKTGIALAWDNIQYYVQLWSRSGVAYKNGNIVVAGVIDFSYRQDVGVLLYNCSDVDFIVKKGDRIAQYNYNRITVNDKSEVVDEFTIAKVSDRNGGFGSTGIN